MSRPTSMKVDGIVYWTLATYDADGVLVDADSTPTVAVRKNGASVGDTVTVAKRSATTGIYDCSHAPAGEVDGDTFIYEESATVSAQAYLNAWSLEVTSDEVDVIAISGDTVAADNLELQYDGTGISGENFPSTQGQVGSIAVAGAAVNTVAESYVLTTGTLDSGAVVNTETLDGVYHQHSDSAGTLDLYYEFDIGNDGVPTSTRFTGRLNGGNDELGLYAYNWVGASWDQVGTVSGINGTTDFTVTSDLLVRNVGIGSNAGLVRIRFFSDSLSGADLYVDQVIASYTKSVSGISNGSTLTLTSSAANENLFGYAWNLVLNGQDISGAYIFGAVSVTGTAFASNGAPYVFEKTRLNDVTISPEGIYTNCGFNGNVTLTSTTGVTADAINVNDCASSVSGTGSPLFDLSAVTKETSASFRRWSGGIQLTLTSDCTVSIDGVSGGNVTINGTGGTVHVRGMFESIVDNSGGSVTIDTDAFVNPREIAKAVWDEPTSLHLQSGSYGLSWDEMSDFNADAYYTSVKMETLLEADGAAGYQFTTLGLENAPSGSGGPTVQQIVDGVWDESSSAHVAGGTFGAYVDSTLSQIRTVVDNNNTEILLGFGNIASNGVALTAAQQNVLASQVSIDALNDFDPASDVVAHVTLVDTTTNLTNGGPTVQQVVDGVWDEVLTGATHNIQSSAGRRVRQLASIVIADGTAQGSGTGNNQIQLDAGASSVDGSYDPSVVAIVSGTGAGQSRLILQYDGATKTATVDRNWKVNPDNTSEFILYANAGREHVNEGLSQGGTSNTITLNSLASSTDDIYVGQTVFIRSGTGDDQAALCIGYNGTTKVATVRTGTATGDWGIIPDTTSGYVVLPEHQHPISEIESAVWDAAKADHTTADTYGAYLDTIVSTIGGGSLTVDAIVDGVWDELQAGHVVVGSFGEYLDSKVSAAGSGGSGLYQATIRVEDESNNALQGARVNIAGTTLTLTTDSSGEVTFNLDAGLYTVDVSPPAGYVTPIGQVVTIVDSDPADTVFSLAGNGQCSPVWIG